MAETIARARLRVCEVVLRPGIPEKQPRRGFLLMWEDVPYILIKVDPKPQEAGKHNSKPRRKKGKNYVLISPYFPRGFLQNGTFSCSRTKALLKLLSVFLLHKAKLS